jgi:error-prone DNA polymerase
VVPRDTQLALDLGDDPSETTPSGLPEMSGAEQVRAELEVLGLDVSRHVVDFYEPFLAALGVTRAKHLLQRRSHSEVLVCGVKVATQTPPIRSGRRVIFVTLDDATGPLDATFFEDAQVGYASTVFHSWLLVVRGVIRRTGPRGVSIRATGCWELPALRDLWEAGGVAAVEAEMARPPAGFGADVGLAGVEGAVHGAAESRSTRPVMTKPPTARAPMGRPHVHPTGFKQSPYSDVAPSGGDARSAPRRLWHSSSGSSGG